MNKKTKLVLDLLKPRATSLGFNKEELEGAAAHVASNLGVDDDATDEVLNAAAEKAIAVYLPILELSQKNANRIIQKNKEEREKVELEAQKKAEAERKAKEEAEKKAKEEAERQANEEAARKAAEEAGFKKLLESEWAKGLQTENSKLAKQLQESETRLKKQEKEFDLLRHEIDVIKTEKVNHDREKKLNELLENLGIFGERIKKNYARMSFKNDEDFNDFISGVQEDIKAFNQERADKGLETLGTPAAGEKKEQGKVEPMSDAEVDALASIM